MKLSHLLLIVVIAALAGFGGGRLANNEAVVSQNEAAFDRVLRTNTLRCGYAIASPWFYVDPNTNEKAGFGFDVTNAVAALAGLKVEWVEETGWGVAELGLKTGRYDLLCGGVCVDAGRIRAASYSTPFQHVPQLAVVKSGDKRFDESMDKINDPSVRIGVKNNHVFEYTAKERFPRATLVYFNDLSDDTEFLTALEAGKIDVAIQVQAPVDLYVAKNGPTVRSLPTPLRYCHGGFMLPLGDYRLKEMLDAALMQLNTSGQLEKLAAKHMSVDPRTVQMPALPYR